MPEPDAVTASSGLNNASRYALYLSYLAGSSVLYTWRKWFCLLEMGIYPAVRRRKPAVRDSYRITLPNGEFYGNTFQS